MRWHSEPKEDHWYKESRIYVYKGGEKIEIEVRYGFN